MFPRLSVDERRRKCVCHASPLRYHPLTATVQESAIARGIAYEFVLVPVSAQPCRRLPQALGNKHCSHRLGAETMQSMLETFTAQNRSFFGHSSSPRRVRPAVTEGRDWTGLGGRRLRAADFATVLQLEITHHRPALHCLTVIVPYPGPVCRRHFSTSFRHVWIYDVRRLPSQSCFASHFLPKPYFGWQKLSPGCSRKQIVRLKPEIDMNASVCEGSTARNADLMKVRPPCQEYAYSSLSQPTVRSRPAFCRTVYWYWGWSIVYSVEMMSQRLGMEGED